MQNPDPPRTRKSLDDRLASLAEQQQQLEARRLALLAVKKSADRKRETRRRIIVGSAVIAEAERDATFADALRRLLDRQVQKKNDRALIADLLPDTESE